MDPSYPRRDESRRLVFVASTIAFLVGRAVREARSGSREGSSLESMGPPARIQPTRINQLRGDATGV